MLVPPHLWSCKVIQPPICVSIPPWQNIRLNMPLQVLGQGQHANVIFFLLKVKVIQYGKWLRWIPKGNHFSTSLEYKLISKLRRNSAFEVLYKCCSFSARYPLCIHVYMIPTTNKIIQLSPYGLQQAITILLTLN